MRETPRPPSPLPPLALGHLSPGYRRFLLVSGLFALALSSNAFLLLRLKELGLSQEEVALAYTLYNLLYALLAYPLGGLADRVGLGRMVATGFGLYALVYLGFAWARTAFWALGFLFLYALYSAAFEGANRAYLATLVPEEAKAGAIGLYHTVVGSSSCRRASSSASSGRPSGRPRPSSRGPPSPSAPSSSSWLTGRGGGPILGKAWRETARGGRGSKRLPA